MWYDVQAFSKIHDEYQFPTRLDLGEFVDREEGGGRLSHTYILHSVLVHSVSSSAMSGLIRAAWIFSVIVCFIGGMMYFMLC